MVKTPHFKCSVSLFDPCSGNRCHKPRDVDKKKKKKRERERNKYKEIVTSFVKVFKKLFVFYFFNRNKQILYLPLQRLHTNLSKIFL